MERLRQERLPSDPEKLNYLTNFSLMASTGSFFSQTLAHDLCFRWFCFVLFYYLLFSLSFVCALFMYCTDEADGDRNSEH